ncbi:ribonuclease D [Halomonas sp. PR-M31]|uniref:ribonuclease D n=1 Tax=Halomonas sp. PR-M31 TaxID=1471202 RepID=UPI00065036EC|nr:ribonuclease D [Halomonas sp. PR-M31]
MSPIPALTPALHWIDTPDALEQACQALSGAQYLALDTEFIRESSFHPVPALVQLSAGDEVYLIDPQALAPNAALMQLLGPNGPLKLLHACGEDLEVLSHWAGAPVAPLIDTQLAQALLSEDAAMSYQRLVERWTGDVLAKDETRSDWLERPLSDAQCRYAALDVAYLPIIWPRQREALMELGRLEWLETDCAALIAQAGRDPVEDSEWYRRNRQLWRLNPRASATYQQLTVWREAEVRERNMPRNWLVSDKILFAIAEAQPRNRYELASVEGVKPAMVKREGDVLLAIVRSTADLTSQQLPNPLPSPLTGPFKRRLKALKQVVSDKAQRLGIAAEILARRRQLEELVIADMKRLPLPLPSGWRGELLNDAFKHALGDSKADRHAVGGG